MKKLTLGVIAVSLVLGGVAHANDDGNLPPPPSGELEGIKLVIQSQCGVSEDVGDEKIECMIGALHSLKENGEICEEAFRFLLREFELRYAYFRGKKDAELNCGGGEKNPPPPGEGGGSDKKKVEICHIPPGNPDNAHTIRVSQSAVDAHLAHGDTLGACADDDSDDNKKDKEKNKDKDKKNKKDKNKNKKGNSGKNAK